jgi:mycothiol synthase
VGELPVRSPTRRIVAEAADGALTGYAVAHRFGTFAAVDPAQEHQGIGARLLDWCESRQRELGWAQHRTSIPAGNLRAKALLEGRGYAFVRSDSRLTLALDEFRGAPVAEDVTVRPLEAHRDGPTLHEVDQAAFVTADGFEPESYAAFSEQHLKAHDLDGQLSRVAERDGEILGFALTRRHGAESAAYVAILAVRPGEQGRGIGRTLLVDVFQEARRAGFTEVQLGVASDNQTALRLYEGLGMRRRAQLDIYARPVG